MISIQIGFYANTSQTTIGKESVVDNVSVVIINLHPQGSRKTSKAVFVPIRIITYVAQ